MLIIKDVLISVKRIHIKLIHYKIKSTRNEFLAKLNVISFRNPTPDGETFKWNPATTENKECLLINEDLQMKTKLHEDRIKFWDDWIEKYKAMAKNNVVKDEL